MTQIEFNEEMTRLIRSWPHKFFQERRVILYDLLKDQTQDWFKKIVTEFLSDAKYPPTVANFRDALIRDKQKAFNEEVQSAAISFKSWNDEHITPNGLRKHLDSIGAKSLVEAVNMERKRLRQEEHDSSTGNNILTANFQTGTVYESATGNGCTLD